MKLSVVIPVFNRVDYVRVMVDSIISQSFRDWELFLVDDGSDSATVALLESYSKSDCRIKFVQRKYAPKGAQRCRNIGLQMSTGDYIMFLDSDDILPNYCFQHRVEYLNSHPELDYAVFPYVSFNTTPGDNPFQMCGGVPVDNDDMRHFLAGSIPFVVWNNIYRRVSLLYNKRFWDEKILSLQDADFNIQNIISGLKYDYACNEGYKPDYFFRIDYKTSHISHKIKSVDHAESHLYFAEKTLKSLSTINLQDKTIRWCIIHKYLLLKDINNEQYTSRLLDIAKRYRCHYILHIQFFLYNLLSIKLRLNSRIIKNIIFFGYYKEFKKDRKIRKIKVSQL